MDFPLGTGKCSQGLRIPPAMLPASLSSAKTKTARLGGFVFAEEVGFEPTEAFASAVFKTARFDHSRTPP